jgi:hypothetical protein
VEHCCQTLRKDRFSQIESLLPKSLKKEGNNAMLIPDHDVVFKSAGSLKSSGNWVENQKTKANVPQKLELLPKLLNSSNRWWFGIQIFTQNSCFTNRPDTGDIITLTRGR